MEEVLFIGPQYRNHRGGIGALLEVYAGNIQPFKFVSTFEVGSSFTKLRAFFGALFIIIWKLISDRKIRILHIHTASNASFFRKSIVVLIGRLFGKKVILHVHGGGFHLFYQNASGPVKWYIRKIIAKATVLICLSRRWKEYFAATFRHPRIEIVNNAFKSPSVPRANRLLGEAVNLLFLGMIMDAKGIFDLIKVLDDNRTGFAGKLTLTVGGNGETERLQQLLAKRQPGVEIHFAGWVSGPKKEELLSACDIYVLPSYNEGLPISILEAMGYGKPIIATNVGGIPEVVVPGYNGWLFEPGDLSTLTDLLSEAVSGRSALQQYGKNSVELAQQYSPETVKKHLLNLYESLNHKRA